MVTHLLESLTESQRAAVEHRDGPMLVLAGPGSGKTRVITHRVAWLLHHGVPARQILALTFTNKAADEMRSRLERLAPGEPVWISTFHRFAARLLRQYAALVGLAENYTIYDADDSRQVLRRVLAGFEELDSSYYTPERVGQAISWAKNNLIAADQYEPRAGQPLGSVVARVYPRYQARLLASNAVDFDDLLMHVGLLLRFSPETRSTLDARYRYVLVDEYQDTNLAQYVMLRALSIDYPNLAVTGDPDQSIYGWRGANLQNILDFEHDFPRVHVVKLEQNFRSTQRIVRVADVLIANNVRRKPKSLFTANDEGLPVALLAYADERQEALRIAGRIAADVRAGRRRLRDFAIFYRTNALSRALEFALREEGVPYQMVRGLEFYQRKEIKDVLAYLRLINNPRDDNALLRIINTPPRGIGKSTIEKIRQHADQRGLTLFDAARESGLVESLNKRAAVAVARFAAILDRMMLVAAAPVEEIMGNVLSESGYQELLSRSEDDEDQERLANIQELLTAARQFDERNPGPAPLEGFLEESSLVSDVDAWEATDDRVTLMTLHASKGLEFPVVFIIAIEEGLIPHERSQQNHEMLEEERRLLFVGITRAKQELELSMATYRDFRGQRRRTVPSNFLMELPRDEMRLVGSTASRSFSDDDPETNEVPWEMAAPLSPRGKSSLASDTPQPWATELPPPWASELPAPKTVVEPAPLQTAAQMHIDSGAESRLHAADATSATDVFSQGMVVLHPKYGLGKIVALGGYGDRRSATVAFASTAGQKKFMLAQSMLRPARGN